MNHMQESIMSIAYNIFPLSKLNLVLQLRMTFSAPKLFPLIVKYCCDVKHEIKRPVVVSQPLTKTRSMKDIWELQYICIALKKNQKVYLYFYSNVFSF